MSDSQCTATTNTGFSLINCQKEEGHDGLHENDTYTWPNVRPLHSTSREECLQRHLTGKTFDQLFFELFQRVENLEQSTADGAATDDMFVAQARKHSHLAQSVGELHARLTQLEAVQVSITNHTNRAMTDLGTGIQMQHAELMTKIDELREVFAPFLPLMQSLVDPPLKVLCGTPSLHGVLVCELEPGHDGRHTADNSSWPNRCPSRNPDTDRQCVLGKGHLSDHSPDRLSGRRWADPEPTGDLSGHPEECHGEICIKEAHVKLAERAKSHFAAAARCPERFREGQCLGYAGHDGDCSAVPDSGNPQLEDPGEFECGMDPAPGHSMPPCGRPKGHDGPCASGPSDENGDPFDGGEPTPV